MHATYSVIKDHNYGSNQTPRKKLSFTAQTVLPRRIQCRYLQQQQIQAVRELNSYQTKIKLSQQSLAELRWWKENLLFQNGKPLSMRNAIVKP